MKKAKVDLSKNENVGKGSLYQFYRMYGNVISDLPFHLHYNGSAGFITACTDRSFQVYDVEKMRLVMAGPRLDYKINAFVSFGETVLIAGPEFLQVFVRSKMVRQVAVSGVRQLQVFGDVLFGITTQNSVIVVDLNSFEIVSELQFPGNFTVSSVLHPFTLLNKIIIGSKEGRLQLWNIRTKKLIYEYQRTKAAITCLTQSPVVDVIAVGCVDGAIMALNIKTDEKIFEYLQMHAVTGLDFRTDEVAHLASSDNNGNIYVWDLENSRLLLQHNSAHRGSIGRLSYFIGKPVLISSGRDNSIKIWQFDDLRNTISILKLRDGHNISPHYIRYYDSEGHFVLSSSQDGDVRCISLRKDAQSFALSKKGTDLPYVKSFDIALNKHNPWATAIGFDGRTDKAHFIWVEKRRMEVRTVSTLDGSIVKSVAISTCGNFGALGSNNGMLYLFNVQSGNHRQSIKAHDKEITGACFDGVNSRIVTSSLDGMIKVWNFKTCSLIAELNIQTPITLMVAKKETGLCALTGDDHCIRIIDMDTCAVVRQLMRHERKVQDMAFSADGKWLVSGSIDGSIITWDLPSGNVVDELSADNGVKSLCFSPTGDFLMTSHMDDQGVRVWANRSVCGVFELDNEQEAFCDMPTEEVIDNEVSIDKTNKTKWKNLINWATIKQRNTPKQVVQKPESLPFFLSAMQDAKEKTERSKVELLLEDSKLAQIANDAALLQDFLQQSGPSEICAEIASLPDEPELIMTLFSSLLSLMTKKREFNMVQTVLNVLLKEKAEFILSQGDTRIATAIEEMLIESSAWKVCEEKFMNVMNLLQYLL